MPEIFAEQGIQHHQPHFHADYNEWSAVYSIDTLSILAGHLPVPQRRLVEAWATLHQNELMENWGRLISNQPSFKIDPLT
jgi:hypothetical protein